LKSSGYNWKQALETFYNLTDLQILWLQTIWRREKEQLEKATKPRSVVEEKFGY